MLSTGRSLAHLSLHRRFMRLAADSDSKDNSNIEAVDLVKSLSSRHGQVQGSVIAKSSAGPREMRLIQNSELRSTSGVLLGDGFCR